MAAWHWCSASTRRMRKRSHDLTNLSVRAKQLERGQAEKLRMKFSDFAPTMATSIWEEENDVSPEASKVQYGIKITLDCSVNWTPLLATDRSAMMAQLALCGNAGEFPLITH